MPNLPSQIKPHKDKIMYLCLAAGGLLAAGIKFEMIKPEHLDGWTVPGIFIAISVLGIWVFQEGFIKLRRKRKAPNGVPPGVIPQQKFASPSDIPDPTPEQVMVSDVPPVAQQVPPQPIPQMQPPPQPIAPSNGPGRGIDQPNQKGKDIFADFN